MTNIIEGRVLNKRGCQSYLEDIKHYMEIGKYCDMKGTTLDMSEWLLCCYYNI